MLPTTRSPLARVADGSARDRAGEWGPRWPEGAPLGGRHEGTEALAAYAATHHGINQGRARHWNWNLLIEGDGDSATMKCYLNAYSAGQGVTAEFRVTGVYRDVLRRTEDGWRFESRQVTVDPA